jgi:hypothetical protein
LGSRVQYEEIKVDFRAYVGFEDTKKVDFWVLKFNERRDAGGN